MFVDTLEKFGIPATFGVRGQLTETESTVLQLVLSSSIKHDIGSHGYSHRKFKFLSNEEAEDELRRVSTGMKKYGITPKSFVFPANSVAHLDLLRKHDYVCYRDQGSLFKDRMSIEKYQELYCIHPSIFINKQTSPRLLERMLDISIERKLPFHVWFHFWNFGSDDRSVKKSIERIFDPFFEHARRSEKLGLLTFDTMLSAAEKARIG
jgi:peptidoglycan/xylan/chitin deacetylase (PgdA/CDA1 family)